MKKGIGQLLEPVGNHWRDRNDRFGKVRVKASRLWASRLWVAWYPVGLDRDLALLDQGEVVSDWA